MVRRAGARKTIFSEQYEFTISLLLLEDGDRYNPIEPPEEDTFDRLPDTFDSVNRETRWRCRLNVLWTAAWMLRKRWADRADLNRCILRSRRRTTWWEFSARLFCVP
jgi:hypothetical protein